MKNLLKGVLAGIGNIIPGLSGCSLLIIFNLYENCIEAISNIFKNFKKSILFLLPIGLGILIGTFTFSNVIKYCLENFPTPTSIIFASFVLGTLPTLFKHATKKGFQKKYILPFLITFTIGILLLKIDPNITTTYKNENLINLILIGIVVASSTIIPGISCTVLLSLMGTYTIYINAISTINLNILIPIGIGFALGAFILSTIINYLFKNYYGYTYFAIIGFTISTIPALINTKLFFNSELIISITLGILAFILTHYTLNISEK